MFFKQFIVGLSIFFLIVFFCKGQTGKVIPFKVKKCDQKVENVVTSVITYVNTIPCVFAVLKESSQATNEIVCTEKFNGRALGLFIPQMHNFQILLRLNNRSSFNLTHNVILHEVGHALGLNHNKNKNSVMYSVASSEQVHTFDFLDTAFLKSLHSVRKGSTCSVVRGRHRKFDLPIVP